jgi:hypothetical protein
MQRPTTNPTPTIKPTKSLIVSGSKFGGTPVVFMDSMPIDKSVEFISTIAESTDYYTETEIFDFIIDWLKTNQA